MLIYHPAYDTNHSTFRMLRLLEVNPEHSLKWDAFRILDLYYLFPYLLSDAQLPRAFTKAKRAFSKSNTKYSRVPAPRVLIQQLVGLHESVARSLIGKGFLSPEAFEAQVLQRTNKAIPTELRTAFEASVGDQPLVTLLAVDLAAIPLHGADGLKERTRLLEHRYDSV